MDTLKKNLKIKTDELEKALKEKKKFEETLKRLKEDAVRESVEHYRNRKAKKPTDLTTKLQLKKMVEDLEGEIGKLAILREVRSLRDSRNGRGNGEKEGQKGYFHKTCPRGLLLFYSSH